MGFLALLLVCTTDNPGDTLGKKMFPIYVREAEAYKMAVESAPDKPLELKKEPVFEWSNPTREGLQQGVVFLWLRDGRPAALGSVFSQPEEKLSGRRIVHEFHALDTEKLVVTRPGENQWKPQVGLARAALPGVQIPAESPAARLLQMRRLAQEFSGYSNNEEQKRWELRLLPTPLFRYPAAKTGVVDGALFAIVSTAGTDPEVLLLIEAREEGGKMRFEYACGRFSDRDLHVTRMDKEIWSSVRSEANAFGHDPQHLYRLYPDKVVSLDGKLLARVRTTPSIWWGEAIPVDEK
jgi:hypothetical protein